MNTPARFFQTTELIHAKSTLEELFEQTMKSGRPIIIAAGGIIPTGPYSPKPLRAVRLTAKGSKRALSTTGGSK